MDENTKRLSELSEEVKQMKDIEVRFLEEKYDVFGIWESRVRSGNLRVWS